MITDVPIVMFNVSLNPKTGGETYYLKVFGYLKEAGLDVRNVITHPDIPWLPLPFRLVIANFLILKTFIKLKVKQCILFEDCYSHVRFFWSIGGHGGIEVELHY